MKHAILPIFLILVACTSLHKRAEILMEGEEYSEAAKVYGQILSQNPDDAKALVGLKKARTQWIDKKLIDVRMLRLAQQAGAATDLLKEIIERGREWQFYPEGAVQYTQEEETQFAVRFISAQVEAWQSKGYLLQGRAFLKVYRPIFATPHLVKRYEELGGRLTASASEQCRIYAAELDPSRPYHAGFVKQYCRSWGIALATSFDPANARAATLMKNLQIRVTTEGIPDILHSRIRDRLTQEFQASPWFAPEASATLSVAYSGAFAESHTKTIEHTVHSYTVQVPYTVMVPQMRTIPHTRYMQNCTSYGCITTPMTYYTYETYTIPVTKYRDEPRQFPFDRWRHHLQLAYHAEAASTINNTEVQGIQTDKADDTDTEHPHSVPNIGLLPDPLTLPDPLRWLEHEIDLTATKWAQELGKAWEELYCHAPDTASTDLALINYIFRCLRQPQSSEPAFVTSWFKERFDAGRDEVERWLVQGE